METYINPKYSSLSELCLRPSTDNPTVMERVEKIISRVKATGDAALRALAEEIDGSAPECLECSSEEFAFAEKAVSDCVKKAIAEAYGNIEAFHRAQLPQAVELETSPGVRCSQKAVPIQRVGLYIPGGTAPLFSTVLMLAIPAKVAQCKEVILCTPVSRQTGRVAPEVLYAAKVCGIDKVYKVGGAQAIAAMAFGTETIAKVDKIFGPGNQYVTTAKQLLGNRTVAIDLPAGPSEVMVMADSSAVAAFVAADLLSQAEHGADSQVILLCDSESFAKKVQEEIQAQLKVLGRSEIASKALDNSRVIIFNGDDSRSRMTEFANLYGPEHLIISLDNPWEIAAQIVSAGSVFIGNWSPESAGDYASGTNHTLPTCGWSRAYSGVNVDSFIRKITFQELSESGLRNLSQTITAMAEAEGLQAHANAVNIRMGKASL